MKLRHILISSSILLIFSLVAYQIDAPDWVHPVSILFFINCLLITFYHHDKTAIPPIPQPLETVEKKQLKELEIAKRVQQALLDVDTPKIESIQIAKRCSPAMTLGGDFYTFVSNSVQSLSQKFKSPGIIQYNDIKETTLGIAIGDVAGHGVSSALVMALSFGILGKIGQRTTSPSDVLKRANEDIRRFITSSQISHVTAIYSIFHPETKMFTYASAGHNPALLIRKHDSSVNELSAQGAFLGMYPDETYDEHKIQLEPGDRVVLYTDGITEPTNDNRELYGEERLKACLVDHSEQDIETLIDTVLNDVKSFSGTDVLKDDRTIIIFEIT